MFLTPKMPCYKQDKDLFSQLSSHDYLPHTRPDRQPEVTEGSTKAYLVSLVTRKKLSSGASIQFGRLLRIITPPREFPDELLRPLCCGNPVTCEIFRKNKAGKNRGSGRAACYLPGLVLPLNQGFLQQGRKTQKFTINPSLKRISVIVKANLRFAHFSLV